MHAFNSDGIAFCMVTKSRVEMDQVRWRKERMGGNGSRQNKVRKARRAKMRRDYSRLQMRWELTRWVDGAVNSGEVQLGGVRVVLFGWDESED